MIFAKLKSNQEEHRILASDPANVELFYFYKTPSIDKALRFNPEIKLESNEWYYVTLKKEHLDRMIKPYLTNATSTGDLNNAAASEYQEVECIYRIFDAEKIIFTRITPSFKVTSRKILRFHDTEQAEVCTEKDSIIFDGGIDAYFDGTDKIYFKKFSRLTTIFPGFEEFHRLATEVEMQSFLDHDLFEVDNLEPHMIGQKDSKKIARILADDDIKLLSGESDASILASVKVRPELKIEVTDDSKILLKNKFALKPVIKVIMGNYFKSEITGEQLEAVGTMPLTERL